MKLVLQAPRGDKGFILFVNELAGDDKFVPHRNCYFECEESERWACDAAIGEAWDERKEAGAKGSIFNQCRWIGSTGWEFWSSDQDAILACAMRVAELLEVDLELA